MQCVYCGTENPQTAVFCKKCGKRLDGMALCPSCGKLTPADGEFCVNCGSNRNAPVYLMPVRFAEAAEKAAPPVKKEKRSEGVSTFPPERVEVTARAATKKSRILSLISLICGSVAALIGMIFVFLIGSAAYVSTGGVSAGGVAGYDIFYFFGTAFEMLTGDSQTLAYSANYTGAVIGALCSAVGLAGTLACFVFTVVRFIKILLGKTQKSILPMAAATYFAYLFSIMLFSLCMAQSVDMETMSTGMAANAITVTGIVLGAILLVASIVLNECACGIEGGVRGYILNLAAKIVPVILVCVALGMVGTGIAFISQESEIISSSTTYGISSYFNWIASVGGFTSLDVSPAADLYNMSVVNVLLMVVAAVAFAVTAVIAVMDSLGSVGKITGKRGNILMGVAGVCAVVCGIFMCVASYNYIDQVANEAYSMAAAVPVVTIVAGALVCVAVAVFGILQKKKSA